MIHRAEVAEADSHALARFATQRLRCPGTTLLLNVSTLKSVISIGFGRRRARVDPPLAEHEDEVAIDRGPVGSRGWTTNMPIMPSAICVISSKCGWYMIRAGVLAA